MEVGEARFLDLLVEAAHIRAAIPILHTAGVVPPQPEDSPPALFQLGGSCPACGSNVVRGQEECPECHLSFWTGCAICPGGRLQGAGSSAGGASLGGKAHHSPSALS